MLKRRQKRLPVRDKQEPVEAAAVQNKSDVVVHRRKHIFKVFASCLPIRRTTLLSAYKQSNRNSQVGDFREAWAGAEDGK